MILKNLYIKWEHLSETERHELSTVVYNYKESWKDNIIAELFVTRIMLYNCIMYIIL